MYSYIKGELAEVSQDAIVVETGGVGYQVYVPSSLLEGLPEIGSLVKVYTYLYVREENIALYGFFTKEDLQFFKLLLGVSGIGPKGALGVLASMTPDDLRLAVLSGDDKRIAKTPGIGLKTAQKVIIELKDKLDFNQAIEIKNSHEATKVSRKGQEKQDHRSEAVQALAALGYSLSEATKAVRGIDYEPGMSVEDILKEALKNAI